MAGSNPENRGRLSLQFNLNDDSQRFAYEILKSQGHRKSVLISEAVKFYMENNQETPFVRSTINSFQSYQAKEILKLALEEIGPVGLAALMSSSDRPSSSTKLSSKASHSSDAQINSTSNAPVAVPSNNLSPVSSPKIEEAPLDESSSDADDSTVDALFEGLDLFG